MSEDRQATLELLDRLVASFNSKDLDTIVDAFTEDGEFLLAAVPAKRECYALGWHRGSAQRNHPSPHCAGAAERPRPPRRPAAPATG